MLSSYPTSSPSPSSLDDNRLNTLDSAHKLGHLVDIDATLRHTAEVDALTDIAVLALLRVSVPAPRLAVEPVPVGQIYRVDGVVHGDVVKEEGVVAMVPVLAVWWITRNVLDF